MNNISQIIKDIDNIDQNNYTKLLDIITNKIKTKQIEKFNQEFPDLNLIKISKIETVDGEIYCYNFSSVNDDHKFQINKNTVKKPKYWVTYYVNGILEFDSAKIPENKFIKNNYLQIDFVETKNKNVSTNKLCAVINYLFFNSKFIYVN